METGSQPPEPGAMAQHHVRKRAQSRASTASIHSISTQPNLEQSFAHNAVPQHHHHHHNSGTFPDQWSANEHNPAHTHSLPKDLAAQSQMSAEEMMLRPASQLQAPQSFPMDTSMHSTVSSTMPYTQHPGMHHPLAAETFSAGASFTDPDSQMMDRDDNEDGDSFAGIPPATKPTGSRTSANNELEMRQLYSANRHRKLEEVATELHGNERGPNSERARQVFAMLWINSVCTKGKGSVPRGRVYANYASRCATERITVLNPASFGKLVRVLFPGLKTRRLGVRGESKYHYVDFSLSDDQPELREPPIQPAIPYPEPSSFSQAFHTTNSQSPALNAERQSIPPSKAQHQLQGQTVSGSHPRTHSLYNQPDVSNIDQLHSTTSKTMLRFSFVPDHEEPFQQSEPLRLPRIDAFLPPGTDPDAAKSLTALYRSHCTSLVECIRYCKEKTFFHLYTSFQGTLTMPVQKLFSHPNVAAWIEECDFILYQRMVRIISGLTLQVVPKPVLDTLRNISERLVPHIRDSFQGQPRHVVQAKEAPATIFAGLLDRALRVNLTAHAAANMLSNPANRDQMYLDWITMVRIRKVAECVPTRGMDDVVSLLLNEIRDLLDPVSVPWEIECLTLYGDIALRNGRSSHEGASEDNSAQNVLDRWVSFLRSLATRFPYASPEDIVWCVQRVGTDVMRDLTIAQGKSFGSWWVTKCWIDEMISFLAELGGFIQSKSSIPSSASVAKRTAVNQETSRQGSRLSSASEEFNAAEKVSQPPADRAPFPTHLDSNQQENLHDDSAIGIRTPEEEFPMDKFEFQQDRGQDLQLALDQSLP